MACRVSVSLGFRCSVRWNNSWTRFVSSACRVGGRAAEARLAALRVAAAHLDALAEQRVALLEVARQDDLAIEVRIVALHDAQPAPSSDGRQLRGRTGIGERSAARRVRYSMQPA